MLQRAIKTGPALLFHLPLQAAPDLQFGARAQPIGGEFAGAMTHAIGDVIAGDNQIPPLVIPAPQYDMGMGVVGVPVIHRYPI